MKKSQTERIADILVARGYISNFDAIHSRLSLRLGARIWDLRHTGWQIDTEEQPDKDTIYRLVARPGDQMGLRF